MNLIKAIEKFKIVNKSGHTVPFVLNAEQQQFLDSMTSRDVILKSRQIGFSSVILALFTIDFLSKENSRSVCISHNGASAQKLLDRVKYFIDSIQNEFPIDLKINSRNELVNADQNSSFYIGTSGNKAFGRGDTLTNLHLSEFAFYEDPEPLLASVSQAVVPTGRIIIESTANGMNYFKTFWEKSKAGETGYRAHFFSSGFYSKEFLVQKQKELADLFPQEYPVSDLEAFLSSGRPFFDKEALKWYSQQTKDPISSFDSMYDLSV